MQGLQLMCFNQYDALGPLGERDPILETERNTREEDKISGAGSASEERYFGT